MRHAFPPVRTEWAEIGPQRAPWPAPEVTSDDPCSAVKPGPVFGLEALAAAQGWTVRVTYARGSYPSVGRRPGVKDSWAVRCSRGRTRAVAVREGDSWRSFWWWSDETFFQKLNLLAEFEGILKVENTTDICGANRASAQSRSA